MVGWYARTHSAPLAKNAETWRVLMPRHTLTTVLPKYTGCCSQDSRSAAGTCATKRAYFCQQQQRVITHTM